VLLNSSSNITASEIEITIEDNKVFPTHCREELLESIFNKLSILFNRRINNKIPLIHPEYETRILGLKRVRFDSGNFILVLETDTFYCRLN